MTFPRLAGRKSAFLAVFAYWRPIAAYSLQNRRFWELLPGDPGGGGGKFSSPGEEPAPGGGGPPPPGEFPHLTAPDLSAHRQELVGDSLALKASLSFGDSLSIDSTERRRSSIDDARSASLGA